MRELGEGEFGKVLLMQAKVRGIVSSLRAKVKQEGLQTGWGFQTWHHLRLYKTKQLLTLSPISTRLRGLAGHIQLLLLCVQAKCELCSETPSNSILTGKVARSAISNDSQA